MHTLMVYSEAGGVTKTTTAVSLAMSAALAGRRTVLLDLDPRAAATAWLGVELAQPHHHARALLAAEGGEGWIDQLVIPSDWAPALGVIPSARSLSSHEEDGGMGVDGGGDLRLRRALRGLAGVELVVIDMPNRQGGPLTRSALNAADAVVYAANPSPDGVAGVEGARRSVDRHRAARAEIGAPVGIDHDFVVCGSWMLPAVPSTIDRVGIELLRDTGLLVEPVVPHRAIVQECRAAREWYGAYERGAAVADAYAAIATTILRRIHG